MLSIERNGLAGNIAGELHIGIQGPPGPPGPAGPQGASGKDGSSTTISLRYGISSEPMENTVVVWQDTIPQMSETYPYLWIEINTETKTSTGGSVSTERGIIGYYSAPGSGGGSEGGSGGNADQSSTGLSETASNALITLLKNATYVSGDMYPELKTLADELGVELTDYIPATGITLSETKLSFNSEDSKTLIATVIPENTNDVVVWRSSDESIATVSSGVVTPVASGNCTITATAGNVSAKCSVTVAFESAPLFRMSDVTRKFSTDTDWFETTSENHVKIVTDGSFCCGISNASTYTDGKVAQSGAGANPTTTWFTIPAGSTCEMYALNGTGSGDVTAYEGGVLRVVKPNGGWDGTVVHSDFYLSGADIIAGTHRTITLDADTDVGAIVTKTFSTGTIECDLRLYVNGVRYL